MLKLHAIIEIMSYNKYNILIAAFDRQCTTVQRLLDRCIDGKAEISREELDLWLRSLRATKEMLCLVPDPKPDMQPTRSTTRPSSSF
jgi:hypothetical protein